MSGTLTVRGVVATQPRHVQTAEGLAVTTFRLFEIPERASRHRSWFTVSALRRLAVEAAHMLEAGDRVFVAGRLVVREWAGSGPGATAELEAAAIGRELVGSRALDASPANDR